MNSHLPKLVRDTISWYTFNIKLQLVHDALHKHFVRLEQKKRPRIQLDFNHPVKELLWVLLHENS